MSVRSGHAKRPRMRPIIEPLCGGWTAIGDGWAVYARTKDDALLQYQIAESRKGTTLVVAGREKRIAGPQSQSSLSRSRNDSAEVSRTSWRPHR